MPWTMQHAMLLSVRKCGLAQHAINPGSALPRATPGKANRAVNIAIMPRKRLAIRLISNLVSLSRSPARVDRVDSAYRLGHLREGHFVGVRCTPV